MNEKDINEKSTKLEKNERESKKLRKVECPLCGKKKSRNNLAKHLKQIHKKLSADSIKKVLESLKLKRESDLKLEAFIKAEVVIAENSESQIQKEESKKEISNSINSISPMDLSITQSFAKSKFENMEMSDIVGMQMSSNYVLHETGNNRKIIDKKDIQHIGLAPCAVQVMSEAQKYGSNLTPWERSRCPISEYVPTLLQMLSPVQCEWFKECEFPWGYEKPNATMLAFFLTIDYNNEQLNAENRKLIDQLAEKERELEFLSVENKCLKKKLDCPEINDSKIDGFFRSIQSIKEAWVVLEEAIYKVDCLNRKFGAFAGWADTCPDDPIEKGNGKAENYWMKKFGEEQLRNHSFGNKTIFLEGDARRAKEELEKVEKQFKEFRLNCSKEYQEVSDENWIIKQKIDNCYFKINWEKKKIEKLGKEIEEKDERIKYLRIENKENVVEYEKEINELRETINKMEKNQ